MSDNVSKEEIIKFFNDLRDHLCQKVRNVKQSPDYFEGYYDGIFDVLSRLKEQAEIEVNGIDKSLNKGTGRSRFCDIR